MRVLYDHQAFTGAVYGGVARYFYELMRYFSQRSDMSFELSLMLSNNDYLANTGFSNHRTFSRFAQHYNINRVASALNRTVSHARVSAGQFDVFHPTYYHPYFLKPLGKKPFVLTFHDATSERFGKIYPEVGEHLTDVKRLLIERADRIITVSEFSKQELLHFFPQETRPDKIRVVPLGSAYSEQQYGQLPEPVAFPYILYVGKRPLYKNFPAFYRAIQPVLRRHDLHLVCAGGGAFSREEQQLIQASGLAGQVHQHAITDATLPGFYQHARAFVFPSLNEGFGLPVLEAFSCGCPTVLSNRSSLPEVAADAAVYFDPEDNDSMADAVERVATDNSLRAMLVARGTARLAQFSCQKMADQTFDVYQELQTSN
jgi:glycosyltransferase involved in cell wall biosynthesis